ncbi:MAG TPA: hypothetical protein VKN35_09155, partial [Xanthomonadales bacterium]|nr:hypothetical protein [Xanthomonadales bacterium]
PACGWDVYIENRNYSEALAVLDEDANRNRQLGIEEASRYRIFTLWLMDEQALLAQGLPDWQRQLELMDAGGTQTHVESALLSGIQGNLKDVEKSFQLWNRQEDMDWAERITSRHHICRILGMIGATPAAVQCVRDGLEEPSYIDPLVEPYLPFYDSIREEPEFSEMLLDIDAEKGA